MDFFFFGASPCRLCCFTRNLNCITVPFPTSHMCEAVPWLEYGVWGQPCPVTKYSINLADEVSRQLWLSLSRQWVCLNDRRNFWSLCLSLKHMPNRPRRGLFLEFQRGPSHLSCCLLCRAGWYPWWLLALVGITVLTALGALFFS